MKLKIVLTAISPMINLDQEIRLLQKGRKCYIK